MQQQFEEANYASIKKPLFEATGIDRGRLKVARRSPFASIISPRAHG